MEWFPSLTCYQGDYQCKLLIFLSVLNHFIQKSLWYTLKIKQILRICFEKFSVK